MQILGRYSIRKTLQLVILVASSSALLMATIGFSVNDWYASRAQLFEQLRSEASIIANNSLAALTFEDQDAARRTLASLVSERNIIAAALYRDDGTRFASFEKQTGFLPDSTFEQGQGEYGELLFLQLPIVLGEETLGAILLLADHSDWQKRQVVRLLTAFGLFVLSLMLAMLISSRLQRLVTQPLFVLTDTARRITQSRDYSVRAEVLSGDEIGRLASDFNEMLDQIQLRDEELRRAQEQLEDKVAERTLELQDLARRLEHQAYHDSLTGLANRITFDNRLRDGISQARRFGGQLSVMFLDLDRFKVINDTLGHGTGDRLLVEVARRLKNCLRETDTLARLGGDEFAVLLVDVDPGHTGDVANKLLHTVRQPMEINGHSLQLTSSIGISVYPGDGDTAAAILKNADTAMYRSKDRGRNRLTFFAPDMNERVERRLVLENKLRRAIHESRFSLAYQAKWSCKDSQLVGVEVLVRWVDEEEGNISPEEFIPLAEDCGLIVDIDLWVLENACRDMLKLHRQGFADLQLSVNFSPLHFAHHDAYMDVANILVKTGFPGHKLELEITEGLIGPDAEDVCGQLRAINDLGVEISIDDFGTAYSSLSRLKQLPLHTLKIDRAFIRDLGRDSDDETLVKTIITMGHNLNLKIVAEGIETQQQHDFVVSHGCDAVQGHLFSKAVSFAELQQLAQRAELISA
ncbi:bifunctional diguanylate cyclase/phosphodiesterase [Pseudomaricurvus sp. HS19]|uniref:putative bifunctional diguanylate cyclase/phosphodiesterase n=1 Tax=Pseudomaricurvus sp. HS19 TaxID=2692626 RepID=UPI00136D52F5|nr:EAL domain-containing protein [Pseudomaricurvus sp. HS19]MYM63204.1 EAL domain-containing protein [Pseudomaricurvus sp. HS19]